MCILRGLSLQLFRHFRLKKYHKCLILLSKIAEIQVWNKLKLYEEALISAQILSAIKSNEQLLTDSQCNWEDYVDINYLLDQNFDASDVDILVFEPSVLSPPVAVFLGGGITWSPFIFDEKFFPVFSRRFMKWNATIIGTLFFYPHEPTKIVLKNSTKFDCTKLHHLA